MKAMKIVLAALAALMVLGGMAMADPYDTVESTVTLNVPSYISVSVASTIPLTNDVETAIASGSDSMVISSTESYYVQGAAPKLATAAPVVTLADGLDVSADLGATTDLYGTDGTTARNIANLGTAAAPLTPDTTKTVALAYTQDTEDIEQGAYTTTVTYSATLVA